MQKDWEPGTQIAFGLIPSTLLCILDLDFSFLVLTVFLHWVENMTTTNVGAEFYVLQLQVTENF